MIQMISKYFSSQEVTHSETASRKGIDNSLPPSLVANAYHAASKMDMVRDILGAPILPSSWYRCPDLEWALNKKAYTHWAHGRNTAAGEDDSWNAYLKNKDHPKALAIDFISPVSGTPLEICRYLLQYKNKLNWKQLIYEHTWVHISWYPSGTPESPSQELTLLANGGYSYGIVENTIA